MVGGGYEGFKDYLLKKVKKVCHWLVPFSQFKLFDAALFFILS